MTAYRFAGIPESLALEARRTMRSPQYGHPAYRERAGGTGPCRLCLRTFEVGVDERLLFTYQPFPQGLLPAPGPIFVHADGCDRYEASVLPPDFRSLPMVVEGYSSAGRLRSQEPVGTATAEAVLDRVFSTPGVAFAHLRNAEAGCFMARVDRIDLVPEGPSRQP